MAREYWRWPESRWISPEIDCDKASVITAGIDVGAVGTQAVVMCDDELYSYANMRTGPDSQESAIKALDWALEGTGMKVADIHSIVGTGYGRGNMPFAQRAINEVACHTLGARFIYGPTVRTIVDMGGQDCKAILVTEQGKIVDFFVNDKCASGFGRGAEVMAELINIPVEELGELSLSIEEEPEPVSSTCYIFANTEAVGLLRAGWQKNDMLAAYCSAIAQRVYTLVGRLKVEGDLAVTGGLFKNKGVVKRLEKELGLMVLQPRHDPQLAGAIGAALFAKTLAEKSRQPA